MISEGAQNNLVVHTNPATGGTHGPAIDNWRHLTQSPIHYFPFDIANLEPEIENMLFELCIKLMTDYRKNARIEVRNYQDAGEMKLMTFYAKRSKAVIDEIDRVLGEHYRFSAQELQHITNYISDFRNTEREE